MNKKFDKKLVYIILFACLYLSTAIISSVHAMSFFGLANGTVMATTLAITFEIGQAAVLFSLLTSKKTQSKVVPWVLMVILTAVQILGNIYSSYEYLVLNSADLLKYFKDPIFIWTSLPDDQCNVILSYIQGSLLPLVALLLTSMVTNYLEDDEPIKDDPIEEQPIEKEILAAPVQEEPETSGFINL